MIFMGIVVCIAYMYKESNYVDMEHTHVHIRKYVLDK